MGSMKFGIKNLFGMVLSTILLLFYLVTWGAMIRLVLNPLPVAEGDPVFLTDGFFYVATASAGIASALAIAILGATPPDRSPNIEYLGKIDDEVNSTGYLTIFYLLAWVVIGVLAVCSGLIYDVPKGHETTAIGTAHQNLKVYGNTWFGMALSAVFIYFKLRPRETTSKDFSLAVLSSPKSNTDERLKKQIEAKKIIFDGPEDVGVRLKAELLRENDGQKISERLQKLVLHLSEIVTTKIRVSSLVRNNRSFANSLRLHFKMFSGHPGGEAVDIGNEEVANEILDQVAVDSEVNRLGIDEIIFDASVSGRADRNIWNYDRGEKHKYDEATLDDHKDHIHFKVF